MLENKIILIVDDDLTLLEMYVERINAEGAIVIQAHDGVDGLEKMRESKPHVILLDVMMPKKSGFDVLKDKAEDLEIKDIPVIILTALNDDQKRKQGLELGASDFIVKAETLPIDVIRKIENVIMSK